MPMSGCIANRQLDTSLWSRGACPCVLPHTLKHQQLSCLQSRRLLFLTPMFSASENYLVLRAPRTSEQSELSPFFIHSQAGTMFYWIVLGDCLQVLSLLSTALNLVPSQWLRNESAQDPVPTSIQLMELFKILCLEIWWIKDETDFVLEDSYSSKGTER